MALRVFGVFGGHACRALVAVARFPHRGPAIMPHRFPRTSRDAVLDAALTIVDRGGLHGLTIRSLARELAVPPMTLYTHFKTKNELLDLTFERLLHRLAPPRHGSTWQAELEEVCRHMRSVLLEHPHWMALVTRVVAPPSALADYDRLLGLMRKDGFSPRAGMFAFSSAISLALGSVLVQRLMDGPHPIPLQRLTLIKGMLATMPRRRYPSIAAAAPRFDRWSFSGVFEIALHSLIAGLGEHGVRYGDGKRRRRRRAYTYRT